MRNIIKSFQILKCNTVIDEFVYSRRGNTYEIYNNSGCLYSGCSLDVHMKNHRKCGRIWLRETK